MTPGGPPGRVVVTGAQGFVGAALCAALRAAGRRHEGWVRAMDAGERGSAALRAMGDLADAREEALCRALDGAAAIVHVAGRAHVAGLGATDDAFRRDNVETTARLALAARRVGVPRFVQVSSVKVNGEATLPGRPFEPDDEPAPADAYGRSKWQGELEAQGILAASQTRLVVLRLPLIYGPGVRANFAALVAAVRARRWLPLGAIDNRRSLLGLRNLAAAVLAVLDSPGMSAGTHFVADEGSISTPELVRAIADASHVKARLVRVPVPLLRVAGRVAGRSDAIDRLVQSLEVDARSLTAACGWRPRAFHLDAADLPPPTARG